MKALIVGLGIGQLYLKVLKDLDWEVITVDSNPEKGADYTHIDSVLNLNFDLAYVGTPNYTHENLARKVAAISKLLLIEKPGVLDSDRWSKLISDFSDTRICMVKNNQYRDEIELFKNLSLKSDNVIVCWNRKNCIPNPGSWFTTKSKAFGGVSRDLMPHMLSYYTALTAFEQGQTDFAGSEQRHSLNSIIDTEYGIIDRNGTYDVDDFCKIIIKNNAQWALEANWKSNQTDDSSITFIINNEKFKFELGWCPESAYKKMIVELTTNLNNNDFWIQQNKQDLWIHQQLELL